MKQPTHKSRKINLKNGAGDLSVLTPAEFIEDIKFEAKKAKKMIWMQAMFAEPGEVTRDLLGIFQNADKSTDKRFYTDYFGLLTAEAGTNIFGQLFFFTKSGEKVRKNRIEKKVFFSKLKDAGVTLRFTNPPNILIKMFPYAGRNHRKITIIDDIVYIGGVNFSDGDLLNIDFMVKFKNEKVALALAKLFIEDNYPPQNTEIIIDEETKILLDAGIFNDSIIYNETVKCAQSAKTSILFISQLGPDGRYLRTLRKASKKGIDVKVIVPLRNAFNKVFLMLHRMNDMVMEIFRGDIRVLKYPGAIHAKLIIVDGKYALFGSHNFTNKGVLMKTNEIAVLSSNKILVGNLMGFCSDNFR